MTLDTGGQNCIGPNTPGARCERLSRQPGIKRQSKSFKVDRSSSPDLLYRRSVRRERRRSSSHPARPARRSPGAAGRLVVHRALAGGVHQATQVSPRRAHDATTLALPHPAFPVEQSLEYCLPINDNGDGPRCDGGRGVGPYMPHNPGYDSGCSEVARLMPAVVARRIPACSFGCNCDPPGFSAPSASAAPDPNPPVRAQTARPAPARARVKPGCPSARCPPHPCQPQGRTVPCRPGR